MPIIKFNPHVEGNEAPIMPMFALYLKLEAGQPLSDKEKETVISNLYGINGQHNGTRYRWMGWECDFRPLLKRYLVSIKYHGWGEYYSFNKALLRKYLGNVKEILEVVGGTATSETSDE